MVGVGRALFESELVWGVVVSSNKCRTFTCRWSNMLGLEEDGFLVLAQCKSSG